MIQDQNIICISDVDWDSHLVAEQQIMSRLARTNRILYLEQKPTFLSFSHEHTFTEKIRRWLHGVRKESENLFVASPPILIPFKYYKYISLINGYFYRRWIVKLVKELQFADPIIITFEPDSAPIIDRIHAKLKIYYGYDDHILNNKCWWNPSIKIKERETELIKKVDIVFMLTQSLCNRYKSHNPNMYVIPNGVDVDSFLRCSEDTPEDIKEVLHPIIGFFGMIDQRFDAKLVNRLAEEFSYASIVLVGPVNSNNHFFDLLKKRTNVFFLGPKVKEEFANYIRNMDVCLIPQKPRYMKNLLGLKLYEYTAVGKPIVSTSNFELEAYPEFVKIGHDTTEFIKHVKNALEENNDEMVTKRIDFARKNTWDDRVHEISRIIRNYLTN